MKRRQFIAASAGALFLPAMGLRRSLLAAKRRLGINVLGPANQAISILKRLGITQVRTTLYWISWADPRRYNDAIQPDPGGLTQAQRFARDVGLFRSAGLDVLAVVHSPPLGMTLAQGVVALPAFMAARAGEFRGLAWQIMNEVDAADQNDNGWFHAKDAQYSQSRRGDLYGQLLAPVYDAIKRADQSALVVSGGIALEPTAFFAGLAARARGKYDAIAVHCYGNPVVQPFGAKSVAMRAVLGGTPLWCTEWGLSTADDSEQSRQIGECLDDNDAHNLSILEASGFTLDSSQAIYKLDYYRNRNTAKRIARVPASVTSSVLRLPALIRRGYLSLLSSPVVLFVHPWEFVDLTRERLRYDCRFRTGEPALDCVRAVLQSYASHGARFVRMRELLPEQANAA